MHLRGAAWLRGVVGFGGLTPADWEVGSGVWQWFLDAIKEEDSVELVGVHSHLGSTIKKARVRRLIFPSYLRSSIF